MNIIPSNVFLLRSAMRTRQAEIESLRDYAGQGDAEAQLELGNAYWYGAGVDKDRGAALRWYKASAAPRHG